MNQQPPVAIASALTFWSKLAEPMVDLVLLGAAVLWGGVGIYKLDGRSALMAIAIGGRRGCTAIRSPKNGPRG